MGGGTIDTLEIEINAESEAAADKVTALIDKLNKLKEATKDIETDKTVKAIKNIGEALGGKGGTTSKMASFARSLTALQQVVASFNGDTTKVTKAIGEIGGVLNKESADNLGKFGAALGALNKATNNAADFGVVTAKIRSLKEVFAGRMAAPKNAEQFANAIEKITKSIAELGKAQDSVQEAGSTRVIGFRIDNDASDGIKNITNSVLELRGQANNTLTAMSKLVKISANVPDPDMGGASTSKRRKVNASSPIPEKPRAPIGFGADWDKYAQELKAWEEEVSRLTAKAEEAANKEKELNSATDELSETLGNIVEKAETAGDTTSDLSEMLENVVESGADVNDTVSELSSGLEDVVKEATATENAIDDLPDLLDKVTQGTEGFANNAETLKAFADRLESIEVVLDRISNVLDTTTDRYEALSDSGKDSFNTERAAKFKDMVDDLRESFISASHVATSMGRMIGEAVSSGLNGEAFDGMKDQMQVLEEMMSHLTRVSSKAKSAMGAADFERSGETGLGKLELEMIKAQAAIQATSTEINRLRERLDVFRSESNIELVGAGNIANMSKAVNRLEINLNEAVAAYKELAGTAREYSDNGTDVTAKKAKEIAANLSSSISEMRSLTTATSALFEPFKKVTVASRMLNETEFSRLETRFLRLNGIITGANRSLNTLNNRMADLEYKKGFDPDNESVQTAINAIDEYRAKIEDMKALLEDISGKYHAVMEFRSEKNPTDEQANMVRDTYNEIAKLAEEYRKLGDVAGDAWMQADNAIKQARREVSTTKDTISKTKDVIEDKPKGLEWLKSMVKELDGVAQKMRDVAKEKGKMEVAKIGIKSFSKSFAETFLPKENGDISGKASKAENKVSEESETSGLQKIQNIAKNVSAALSKIGTVAKKVGKTVLSALSGAFKKVGTVAKNIGKTVLNHISRPFVDAAKKVASWQKALGRVVLYRAIREAISMVTNSFKSGIENLYYYSQLVGTSFAPAMDKMATSALYLKNSLGAMAAPLLEKLAPAVDLLVDKFVALLNVVGKAMAVITGKSVYSQAVKYATQYGDALDDAGGKAEKLKDYVLGIDELNIINDDTSTGSGSGFDADDYLNMFEEVELGEEFDWAQRIKEAIENGDWQGAGQILADKLNSVLESWAPEEWGQTLGEKISDALNFAYGFLTTFDFVGLGSKIALGINGLFDGIEWETLGNTFAEKWNALFDFIYGFATTLEWHKIGLDISTAINGFLDELDAENAAKAISAFVTGLLDTLNTIIAETNWNVAGEKLAEFLNNIDWEDAVYGVLSLITNSLQGLKDGIDAFLAKWDWKETAQQIYTAINQAFSDVDWKGLGETLSNAFITVFDFLLETIQEIDWVQIGEDIADLLNGIDWKTLLSKLAVTIAEAFSAVVTALGALINELDWVEVGEAIGEAINDFVSTFDWVAALTGLVKLANGIFDGITAALKAIDWHGFGIAVEEAIETVDWKEFVSSAAEFLVEAFWAAVKLAFQLAGDLIEIGGAILDGLWEGIKEASANLGELVNKYIVEPFIDAIHLFFGINSPSTVMAEIGGFLIDGLFEGITNVISTVGTWLKKNLVDPFVDGVKNLFGINSPSTVMAEIGDFLIEGLFNGILEKISSVGAWLEEHVASPIINGVKKLFGISDSSSTVFEEKGENLMTGLEKGVDENSPNVLNRLTKFGDDTTSEISKAWDNVKSDASEKWSKIKSDLGTTWDEIKTDTTEKFNEIKNKIQEKWQNVKTGTETKWNNIKTYLGGKWDNIKTDATTKFENIKSTITTKWEETKTNTETKWDKIKTWIGDKWSNIKTEATTKFGEVKSTIISKWTETYDETSTQWDSIATMLHSKWTQLKNDADSSFVEIRRTITDHISSILDEANTNINSGMQNIGSSAVSGLGTGTASGTSSIARTVSTTTSSALSDAVASAGATASEQAQTWGTHVASGFASGIERNTGLVTTAVNGIAVTTQGYIGFSEPDIGPLSDFHTYAPDMMELFASGIRDNSDIVLKEITRLTDSISDSLEDLSYDFDVDVRPSGLEESLAEYDRRIRRTASAGFNSEYTSNFEGSAEEFNISQQENNGAVVSAIYAVASQLVEAINENGGTTVTLDGKTLMNAVEKAQRQRGVNVFPGGVFG